MAGQPSEAAIVSGSYQGAIDADSGLGLIGQTMQVDFSYDNTVEPYFNTGETASYDGFIESMSVTIGANVWQWDSTSGSSFISLADDHTISFLIGVEDRLNANMTVFTGPTLVPGDVDPVAYSLTISLSDNVPFGSPDGLSGEQSLPSHAPNPDLFDDTPGVQENRMLFSFYTGEPEAVDDYYSITTSGVANVPEPAGIWVLGAALTFFGGLMRPRRRYAV